MVFKDSELAHKYLDGLSGIEIGGAAHNPFNLNTLNVDKDGYEFYINEQKECCNNFATVDVICEDAIKLPFKDKSFDFVINSHVIEHIYRPDLAIIEWCRVATKYIFLIVPHKERTFDKDNVETIADNIFERDNLKEYPDKHHNIWTLNSFLDFINRMTCYVEVIETQDPDDKVGNGFTVILKIK